MPGKRGAPKGNKNRFVHGYYSAAAKRERAIHRLLVRRRREIDAARRRVLRQVFDPDFAPAIVPERGGSDDGQDP
jgi:hypothetical protein